MEGTPEFELTGGDLCLDLINTVEGRPVDRRQDLLRTYGDLVAWGEQAGAVDSSGARSLRRAAGKSPRRASQALKRAQELREALFEALVALDAGESPRADDMGVFNDALGRVMTRLRLAPSQAGFERRFAHEQDDLDRILAPVVLAALDLFTSPELERVRVCAADTCDWLFLDQSKNRSRRWCDMKVCGNRAKAQRHYQRAKRR